MNDAEAPISLPQRGPAEAKILVATPSPDGEGRFSWTSPFLDGRNFFRVKAYQAPTLGFSGELIKEMA